MLQNGVAFDTLKQTGGERQLFGVRRHVHAGYGEQVQIHVTGHFAPSAADIQIPSAQRKILWFGWIHHERRRRLEKPHQPVAPVRRGPFSVEGFEVSACYVFG